MKRRVILAFICLLLVITGLEPVTWRSHAQDGNSFTAETPEPSGGSLMLQEPAGNVSSDPYLRKGAFLSAADANADASIGASFLSLNYDDNSVLNSTHFVPPDPIGAAGTDRLIAVVNSMIEARSKAGVLLWRDSVNHFFTTLSPLAFLFDPKVIYDQYENRFLVVALDQTSTTSHILLAVSKTVTPASGTTADWYYASINTDESIGGLASWADYPGFAIDEKAVYVTANMYTHASNTFQGSRLWILDKGVASAFYAGSAAAVTRYNPYASGGTAAPTMPAKVYGASGIGGTGGTYLVSYSGFSSGGNEAVQVVRVNDPLGTTTFVPQFIPVGNIDDTAVSPLIDAPQNGTATPIEVNDRRALDTIWRNNKLWLTTTICPPSGPDTGQTTAHWFRLDTSAAPGGAITLDDQGNIGGEDIATGTYTYFPSLAVNNVGDAAFGFSASAPTKYAGAYATMHLSGDAAGTVQTSKVVKEGVDWYVRTFGGPKNRWGDYTGASLDPTNDNIVWLFNQYAMLRGSASGSPSEDGRWGTAWASITSFLPPTVTTNAADNITTDLATLRGNLADKGTASSANVSFVWGTPSGNLTQQTPIQVMGSTGNFSANLTGLSANTTYYFKATASGDGSANGTQFSFTTTALATPPPFLLGWGTFGSGNGQFRSPTDVAVDASGSVYVADIINQSIQKFSSSGSFITKLGSVGTGDGQFNLPHGLVADNMGNVYVVDNHNNRIVKFSSSGSFITKWGTSGGGDGQFNNPYGVSVDSSGNVYVADVNNNRIQKFSSSGSFITKWGTFGSGVGQFSLAYDVVVDTSGNIYVADSGNGRIQKFSNSGIFITKWGTPGSGDGQFNDIIGVAVDGAGNVYVSDHSNYRVQKFTSDGTLITKWGSSGSGDGQFYPWGLTVDAWGNVYVVDYGNNRIQVFGIALPPTVATMPADNITPSLATLRGTLIGLGTASSANVSFLWGLSADNCTNETPPTSINTAGNFSANLTGLSANTTYYFCAKAVADATATGNILSFTTSTLVSISVTPLNPSLLPGRIQQFSASGNYSDNTTANITGAVTWASSNTTVATVSPSGLATALVAGNTTIIATSGLISSNTTLIVSASVEVNSGQTINLSANATMVSIPLFIKGIPGDGNATGAQTFIFNLSWNKDIIHVDNITAASIPGFEILAGIPDNTAGTANVSGNRSSNYLFGNNIVANLSVSAVGNVGDNTSITITGANLIDQSQNPIPATAVNATVKIINFMAETGISQGFSSNVSGVVTVKTLINRIKNPADNISVTIPGGIGSYTAVVSSNDTSAIQFVAVYGVPPFNGPSFNATTGVFGVANVTSPIQPGNNTVAEVVPVLTGNTTTRISLTVAYQIISASGQPALNVPEEHSNNITLQRGDADNNGTVSVVDSLAIKQYLVGQLTLGQINAINASGPNHDGANGDKITVVDALAIEQMLVHQINVYFH